MKPTFPGILGREFARVDQTTRSLRPGSVPGMRVSRTTKGTILKPIPQILPRRNRVIATALLMGVYDDVLLCLIDGVETLVMKPKALRCGDWGGPVVTGTPPFQSLIYGRSWQPGKPFRYYNEGMVHPECIHASYDFRYFSPWARTKVIGRGRDIPHWGPVTYMSFPQVIDPPYPVLLTQPPPNAPPSITAVRLDEPEMLQYPVTDLGQFPAGTQVHWIDLNENARRWVDCAAVEGLQSAWGKVQVDLATGVGYIQNVAPGGTVEGAYVIDVNRQPEL